MTTNEDTPPNLIASAMKRVGRSKKWTAEQSGIPLSTFLRKLRGHGDFTLRELALAARALNVSPASFLPDEFREVA